LGKRSSPRNKNKGITAPIGEESGQKEALESLTEDQEEGDTPADNWVTGSPRDDDPIRVLFPSAQPKVSSTAFESKVTSPEATEESGGDLDSSPKASLKTTGLTDAVDAEVSVSIFWEQVVRQCQSQIFPMFIFFSPQSNQPQDHPIRIWTPRQ
jgi:hypothetical protein